MFYDTGHDERVAARDSQHRPARLDSHAPMMEQFAGFDATPTCWR
jgi:hypothetical protein